MMDNFRIENNLIYANTDLKITALESVFRSNLSFNPSHHNSFKEFDLKTGKLIRSVENGGICLLRYLDDNRNIMFRNTIITSPLDNPKFKFCSEKLEYIEKDKPIIEIIENVDYDFPISDLDISKLSTYFEIDDFGFRKDIRFVTKVKLAPHRGYIINSGIKIPKKGKYLFLAMMHWKYGLVIVKSFEVTQALEAIKFDIYNGEHRDTILGEHEDYSTIYSIVKLKE